MELPWRDLPAAPDGPPISTSLTQDEMRTLAELSRGQRVLEVGSAYGFSAIMMALAGASHVVAVDPHTGYGSVSGSLERMRANLEAYGVASSVTVVVDESWHALAPLQATGARFGLIFVDGDHRRETVGHDARQAVRLLTAGGTIAFHDYGEDTCPGVREALDDEWPYGPWRLVDTLALYRPCG